MQQRIHQFRERFIYWILPLFVPLEVLPFFWQPENLASKIILVIKFACLGLLYLLYADKQKWHIHAMLCVTCIAMGIAVAKHGGAGTFLLIMTMFFALIVLPRIELHMNCLRLLYISLAIGGVCVSIYGIYINYSEGITAFSWRGVFNPNTFGMLVLSIFFYYISALHLRGTRFTWTDLFLLAVTLYLILKTECRSALLCVVALIICYIMTNKTRYGRITYYLYVAVSVVVCLAIACIECKWNLSSTMDGIEILGKKLFSGREVVWSSALRGFLESPLWGQPSEYLTKLTHLSSAHNVFMGILVAEGLIPSIVYLKLLLTPTYQLDDNGRINTVSLNKLCFFASIILSTFECAYTDNRLALLYLPLLFGVKNTNQSQHETESIGDSENCEIANEKVCNKNQIAKTLAVCTMIILAFIVSIESIVQTKVHDTLPMKADDAYLEEVRYRKDTTNLLGGMNYRSIEGNGVIWEWNGATYDVVGTATDITFANFYASAKNLPEWIERGKQYRVIYVAETVRFQMYCYLPEKDEPECIVDTTTSISFTIPEDITGLVIRIALRKGETARESVMPILYAEDNEGKGIPETNEKRPDVKNRYLWNDLGYPTIAKMNLLDNRHNASIENQTVIWEWNGEFYYVEGNAHNISFVNLYASAGKLPDWLESGNQYHLVYEADTVRLQLFYYTSDGQLTCLVDTLTSIDFSIPSNATGLIIRLALQEGETACESVMPLIMMGEKWADYCEEILVSTGDETDRTDEIRAKLQVTGVCNLGTGKYYVSDLVMPDGTSIIGNGFATEMHLLGEGAGYVVKLGSNCEIHDVRIIGNDDEQTMSEQIGERHGVVWSGKYQENKKAPQRSMISNIWIQNFSGGV